MSDQKNILHDDSNGLDYVLVGDYYLPMMDLPEETRPIGYWGMLRKEYMKNYKSGMYSYLLLTGKLDSYLADLNEQAQERYELIGAQMRSVEGVTEELKVRDSMEWVGYRRKGRDSQMKMTKEIEEFINLTITEHMGKSYADWKLSQPSVTEPDEIEEAYKKVIETLSAEQEEVITKYCDAIFSSGAEAEEFFYRLGLRDGLKLRKVIKSILKSFL